MIICLQVLLTDDNIWPPTYQDKFHQTTATTYTSTQANYPTMSIFSSTPTSASLCHSFPIAEVSTGFKHYENVDSMGPSKNLLLDTSRPVRSFSCPECPYNGASKYHIERHMRVHTGERPYRCSYCGKSFVNSDYLTIHTRIHTGEKPYACQFCLYRSTQKSHMTTHVMSKHSDRSSKK